MKNDTPQYKISKIALVRKGKIFIYTVRHNLPNVLGMSIEDALDNWYAGTNINTIQSFCNYVNNKGIHHIEVIDYEQYT